MKKLILILLAIGLRTAAAQILETLPYDESCFHSTDTLAPRDDLGLLHQSRTNVSETDFAARYSWRPLYWLEGGRDLVRQPAYVGALQRDLKRLGYYCGPIDGVFSLEVSDAIARLQKNYSMHVTGTLTVPVRRALHLP
ncbi:MAG TPA: peptidoglycan-binding domain-containing protein [Chthoniobacterales bacterium]|nr:peptidoglycan-binding domain-containing protein [Chthoniobacterales bacterium]